MGPTPNNLSWKIRASPIIVFLSEGQGRDHKLRLRLGQKAATHTYRPRHSDLDTSYASHRLTVQSDY